MLDRAVFEGAAVALPMAAATVALYPLGAWTAPIPLLAVAAALTWRARRAAGAAEAREQALAGRTEQLQRRTQALADVLRSVFAGCATEFDAQFSAVREELARLDDILTDAIATLVECFDNARCLAERMALLEVASAREAKVQAVATLSRIRTANSAIAVCIHDLSEIAGELDKNMRVAVGALQFQDVASQLLGHTRKRVEQADALAKALTASVPLLAQDGEPARLAAERVSQAIAEARSGTAGNPVRQASMHSGSVDLF